MIRREGDKGGSVRWGATISERDVRGSSPGSVFWFWGRSLIGVGQLKSLQSGEDVVQVVQVAGSTESHWKKGTVSFGLGAELRVAYCKFWEKGTLSFCLWAELMEAYCNF